MAERRGKMFTPPSRTKTWRSLNLSIALNGFPFTVRVSIQTAMEDAARMSGHRYCETHMMRVTQKSHCPECGECETITAYEHDGQLVTLTDSEATALVPLDYEKAANMTALVDGSEVDPIYIEGSYAVWWADDPAAKNYALLAAALKSSGKWLLGTTQLGRTTRGFALRYSPAAGTLVAHTLTHDARVRWAHLDSVREAVEGVTAHVGLSEEQAEGAALMLADNLDDTFDLTAIEDTYDRDLREAISLKAAGADVSLGTVVEPTANVVDLMDALRASVAASGEKKATAKKKPAAKKKEKVAA